MAFIFSLFSSQPYLASPQGWIGWLCFFFFLCLIGYLNWKLRSLNQAWNGRKTFLMAVLLIFTLGTNLFFGIHIPIGQRLPMPDIPLEPRGAAVMVFSAIPWIIGGGLLGPAPATFLAFLAGFVRAPWETHSPFTPLEFALLAILFVGAIRQPYRTPFFRMISHPLIAALLLILVFPFLHLVVTPFAVGGNFVNQLDYAFNNLKGAMLSIAIELLIASLCGELIARLMPNLWGRADELIPSPAEKGLQARFLMNIIPITLLMVLALIIGVWIIAGNAARRMLKTQMTSAAQMAAENVPYFLETGQSLITKLAANPELLSQNQAKLANLLAEDIQSVPFFNQLTVLNSAGEVVQSYPTSHYIGPQTPIAEQAGIELALQGASFQTFSVKPAPGQSTAQISFMTTIKDSDGSIQGVLLGRTELGTNPFTQPILASLKSAVGENGQGLLLDEDNLILVHDDPDLILTPYSGQTADQTIFYEDTAPDGTRQLVIYQPAMGRPWAIVLMVPAYRAQMLALEIATPLLGIILILAMIATVVVRIGLRMVTVSLENLAAEAGRLAQGRLEQPLLVKGEDEVGQLRHAFEQMRVSLKARMDDLNSLLKVSQGVASSLEISEAVQPVLEAALATGASAARVVLTAEAIPDLENPTAPVNFGLGREQNLYQELDDQILTLTRSQDRLVLANVLRPRLLTFTPGADHPASLLAVALRHENQFYGSLWVAYAQPHNFSEEEVRFLVTLGSQLALAAANARLFLNAEIGRQRLAAILASSPDPILVTDQNDRLLLANPAAWQALGLGMETSQNQPIGEVISDSNLVELLRSSNVERQSKEITLPGGKIYLATATPVIAEGQRVGRVCALRDITHFKELDTLKSDFVSTVSHDLRSPLTLMRGYSTMLEMVGQLNDQQLNYVRKIVTGVDNMTRLINNLLDLGRIEAGVGLQLEMVSVAEIVEKVINTLQLQANQNRIHITSELPAQSMPLIEADSSLLQQALQNLVENAIKYCRPEGKVHLRVLHQPIGIVFEVIDNGIGVSPMDLPRLFEKFYRGAQQSTKEQRGTGLGLAIVKSIAERHNGRVWAESQLGKGSVFRLLIPLRQSDKSR